MKIEVEIPNEVWEVKITLPEQKYSRAYDETRLFYNFKDARNYMLRECRRMEGYLLERLYSDNGFRQHTVVNTYDYDFTAWGTDNAMACRILGGLYKKTIVG